MDTARSRSGRPVPKTTKASQSSRLVSDRSGTTGGKRRCVIPGCGHRRGFSVALNTGILADQLAAVDIDVPVQPLADKIVHCIERRLGPTPLVRIGRAPKILSFTGAKRRIPS